MHMEAAKSALNKLETEEEHIKLREDCAVGIGEV